ncbi:Gfo/Idh/MocA family protein [Eisenbergiella tayi]|uniref:Gfo/Idh/MocA family protein n=1 Tax=Eisenbergiella tayi TaxID=1432052 RepID=UPI000E769767|nr:Gfo/Idh/MocA family oxidoreductase [Eisenbergiella tayi]RJW41227.1 gfo/Idh/MocA family oxidoreductase [Lachnospiraceae bacterium TF09-5]
MKKIKFGVISASGMAQNHMAAICENNRAELKAVCDIDLEKALAAAAKFSLPPENVYTDYRLLLEREEIDAVVICTPDQLHRQMTEDSLAAGKHVLCEKPMALTREDCSAMIRAGEESGKKFMIGQICRYTPGFQKARELIASGEIGELFYVESEYAHDYEKVIPDAGNWRADPKRSGFLGGGCHAVDLLRWIAGDPIEVMAYANKKMLTYLPTDDCTISIMKFPNGVIGKVFVSIGCKRNYTMRSVFYGSRGTIIADNTTPSLTLFKAGLEQGSFLGCESKEVPILYPIALNNHNTVGEIEDFVTAIAEDKAVSTDGRQGAATVAASLAVLESVKTGLPVKPDYTIE